MLAGISSDYYLRLEQGREHHPSAQVIDALARALQLDEHATPTSMQFRSRPRRGIVQSNASTRRPPSNS